MDKATPEGEIADEFVEDDLIDVVVNSGTADASEDFDDATTEAEVTTVDALLEEIKLEDNVVRVVFVDDIPLDTRSTEEEIAAAEEA